MAEENQPGQAAEKQPAAKKEDSFRYIVRVANTDLDGNKEVVFALRKVKGVSYSIANAACKISGVDCSKKVGHLSEAEASRLTGIISNPSKHGAPAWLLNRRKDPETGGNKHIITGDLQFTRENDIKMLRKMKCYRGSRHSFGLPTRGQRTKSNFRKTKSRGKGSIGVQKKKAAPSKK